MTRGDEHFIAICNKTGGIAIYNESLNLFLSPLADGPIKFDDTLKGGKNINNISRFGRSFSIIRVPYTFKLLMQELQTMNVQMRVITDSNVDQLLNMCFSKNINKLLHQPERLTPFLLQEHEKNVKELNKKIMAGEVAVDDDAVSGSNLAENPITQWIDKPADQWTNGPADAWKDGPMDRFAEEVSPEEASQKNVLGIVRPNQEELLRQQGDLIKQQGEILRLRQAGMVTKESPAMREEPVAVQPLSYPDPVLQDPELKRVYDNLPQKMKDDIYTKQFSQEKMEKLLGQLKNYSGTGNAGEGATSEAVPFSPVDATDVTNILKVQEAKEEAKESKEATGEDKKVEDAVTDNPPTVGGAERKTISFNV